VSAVLLDTHVFVWLMQGVDRLGDKARSIINGAIAQDELYISAITPWEIALLVSKSRLALPEDVLEWLQGSISASGIGVVPLSLEVSVASTRLPGELHRDPADRLIVATARHLNALLITEDGLILNYAAQGHVRTVSAS
jgi:PIN domain nuclease of toxin-antitoxin system